jgi:methylthioxylose transferase
MRATMQRAFQPREAFSVPRRLVPRIVTFAALATVAVGLTLKATTNGLGSKLPPFVMGWEPRVGTLAAVSALALSAGALVAPRAARTLRSPLAFAGFLFALALGLGLALNLARHGVRDWYAIFDTSPHGSFEAPNEYLPGLPALAYGAHFYLDRFAEMVPALPVNVAGHTPGLLLTLHALRISTPEGMAALCIGVGALTAPLAYDLGRTLLGDERGRSAGLLTAFAPSLLLFGVTSADYFYAGLGLASACLLVRPRLGARIAGAAAAAGAAFFSWLLLALPAWAALVVWRREGWRSAARLALACAAALLVFNGALALWVGYDAIGTLRATGSVYRHSLASVRPYAFWVFGSPTAWGVMLGVAIAMPALRALVAREPAAVALAIVVVAAALLGFTKAETERIWLPFVPLACVAAAAYLPPRRLAIALLALAAQALVVELLFQTIW